MKINYLDISKRPSGLFTFNNQSFSYRKINSQRKDPMGELLGLVMHHSGVQKGIVFDDYHFNITEGKDGQVYVFKTLGFNEKGQHLWGRNTGLLATSLCCLATGKDTPTENMIKANAILNAEKFAWKRLNFGRLILPAKKIFSGNLVNIVGETITIDSLSDHGSYAKLDGYFPDRWDVGEGIKNTIITLTKKHYSDLKSGKAQFIFKDLM